MQASNAPSKSAVPFAESGTKNTIPVASQIGITPGAASFTDGFPPLTMTPLAAGGVPPGGADFNGILYFLSAVARWSQAGGGYKYDGAFATAVGGYPRGATLLSSDGTGTWRSIAENNTTDPDAGGAGWVSIASAGLAGTSSNLRSSVTTAAASATFTADELVVASALGGSSYRLPSFSKSVNLGTVGVGGMDTGTAPNNGFVAVYAIYNPTTGASALLARNATAAAQPTVYGGANMPAGYTASALISVWPTNASGQLKTGLQSGRNISIAGVSVLSSTAIIGTYTVLSIASAVPLNAKAIGGFAGIGSSINTALGISVCSDANGSGLQIVNTSTSQTTAPFQVSLSTPQALYYSNASGGGTTTSQISISSYDI